MAVVVKKHARIDIKKLSLSLIGGFFDRTTFSQSNERFFEKLNHRWKYREQKQNFKLIMVIIFYTDPIDHNLNET